MNTNIKISSPPKTTTPPPTPLYIDDSTDNFLCTNPHNGIPEYCMQWSYLGRLIYVALNNVAAHFLN